MHRNVNRTLVALLIVASCVLATSAASAQPASSPAAPPKSVAPPKTAAAAAACTEAVDVGLTVKSGSYIKGSASYTRCAGSLTLWGIRVDLNKVYGPFGRPVKTWMRGPAPAGPHSIGLSFYCGGSGVHTYYTTIASYNIGWAGVTNYKRSNYLRVRC
jgi:hypothetical protein